MTRYRKVTHAFDAIMKDADATRVLEKAIEESSLIKTMLLYRLTLGVPQKRIAEAMHCSHSRISKLEGGDDGMISWTDVVQYFNALHVHVHLMLDKQDLPAATRIRQHVTEINRLLESLAAIIDSEGGDPSMRSRITAFYGEVLFPLILRGEVGSVNLPSSLVPSTPAAETTTDTGHARAAEPKKRYARK